MNVKHKKPRNWACIINGHYWQGVFYFYQNIIVQECKRCGVDKDARQSRKHALPR